jgi:hypothetical protein
MMLRCRKPTRPACGCREPTTTPLFEGSATGAACLDFERQLNKTRAIMDVLTRLAALLIAVLLAIDAFAGGRSETLRVEHHTRLIHWHHGDDFRLHFSGGHVESCSVGPAAFDALADGDVVAVDSSRVFKSCTGIRRGDEVVVRAGPAKWLVLLPMAFLLAAAFGWIRFEGPDDSDRRERDWWFGW